MTSKRIVMNAKTATVRPTMVVSGRPIHLRLARGVKAMPRVSAARMGCTMAPVRTLTRPIAGFRWDAMRLREREHWAAY
jgi:hypothetical protein